MNERQHDTLVALQRASGAMQIAQEKLDAADEQYAAAYAAHQQAVNADRASWDATPA